jgi:hypothetical protein
MAYKRLQKHFALTKRVLHTRVSGACMSLNKRDCQTLHRNKTNAHVMLNLNNDAVPDDEHDVLRRVVKCVS